MRYQQIVLGWVGTGSSLSDDEYADKAANLWRDKLATHARYFSFKDHTERKASQGKIRAMARRIIENQTELEFVCQCAGVSVEAAECVLRRAYEHPDEISFCRWLVPSNLEVKRECKMNRLEEENCA